MQLTIPNRKTSVPSPSVSTGSYWVLITADGVRCPIANAPPGVTQYSVRGMAAPVANPPSGPSRQPSRARLGVQFMQTLRQPDFLSSPKENIEARISAAFTEWMRGIGPISDPKKIVAHPAYKRIVSTGKAGIPAILRRLEREPSMLAWALFDITGENPVRAADSGKIDKITKAWLKWGKKNKYIK